jgi:Trk K+ transport system NAD-binding subunit
MMNFTIKHLPHHLLHLLQRIMSRRNAMLLLRFVAAFIVLLTVYSVCFHYLMRMEDRNYSAITGVYWTFSTMTTLGLGDITFESDLGKLFTMAVVGTGVLFLLVLIPFVIIQLFQSSARVPRELPEGTSGHVILVTFSPLTNALIERLRRYGDRYVVLTADLTEAMHLKDQGIKTVAGEFDDPKTFQELRIERAAFVVMSASDVVNTSLTYTVRQTSSTIPIIATAQSAVAVPILEKAGCTHVLALDEMMGQSLARRIIAGDAMAHVIGQIDELVIAEAAVAHTPLVGKTLAQANLMKMVGVTVAGIWENGIFSLAEDHRVLSEKSILVVTGTQQQIDNYNELFCIYNINSVPIVIIGGGSVGKALARAVAERDLEYRIVEKNPALIVNDSHYLAGDITDPVIVTQSGFAQTPAVAVTSHDDPTNIYLTTFLRHTRNDVQIISRATLDRNVRTLHTAGCDFVVSHASLGANNILHLSKRGSILMLAEGVDVFRVKIPKALAGNIVRNTSIRNACGCSIVGIYANGSMIANPRPDTLLTEDDELILIGSVEAEEKFFRLYNPITENA